MKLLVTIVKRGKGEAVTAFISGFKVDFSVIFLGEGTASSKMLEYLSLADTKKDVVFSLVDDNDVEIILERLDEEFQIKASNHGMAYTVNLTSMSSLALKHLMKEEVKINE